MATNSCCMADIRPSRQTFVGCLTYSSTPRACLHFYLFITIVASGGLSARADWYDVQAEYIGEYFSNLLGGKTARVRGAYRGKATIGSEVTIFNQLGSGKLSLFISLQNGHGDGISEPLVGDIQTLSNIDADDYTQLDEFWMQYSLVDSEVLLRIGKQDANKLLCTLEAAQDFVHSSFGIIPGVPLPTFPVPALGATISTRLHKFLEAKAGIYDGQDKQTGVKYEALVPTDVAVVVAAELTGTLELSGPAQSTFVKGTLGLWGRSISPQSESNPAETNNSTNWTCHRFYWGTYLLVELRLLPWWLVTGHSSEISLFFQLSVSPKNPLPAALYAGTGFVYSVNWYRKSRLAVGLGVASLWLENLDRTLAGNAKNETAFEFYAKAKILPWLSIQPELQYILTPSGMYRNCVVGGMRFMWEF